MDIQIPLKWYYILLLVIPALISAFLVKPELQAEGGQHEENKVEHKNLEIRNGDGFKFLGGLLCQFLKTCVIYVGIFSVAILIYAIVRYCRMGQSNPAIIFSIWWSFIVSYVPTHWAEMVLIPFVTTVAASRIHSRSWNVIIAGVLAVVLIVVSVFTNTEVRHILPMEEEILAELKSQPIFDYSISDISGFREMVNAGYGVTDEEGEESENPDRPSELDLDMETLSVSQLLLCMDFLFGNDSELCREYAKRAYYFYQSGTVTDHHDAGRVLFYYAYYYEYPDYLKAADEFESAEEYNNAVLCLWYYCGREKGAFRDLTGRIVDDAIKAVESGRTSKSLKWTQEISMAWYSQAPYDSWPEDFDRLCSAAPDEALSV